MLFYRTKNHLANAERIHYPYITKDEQLSFWGESCMLSQVIAQKLTPVLVWALSYT